jgi:hypothetical protein
MGWIPDILGVHFPTGRRDFAHIQISLNICDVYPPSYPMVKEAVSQVLMWTEHEVILNVVAQKQISVSVGN